jgi:hypothetical protein
MNARDPGPEEGTMPTPSRLPAVAVIVHPPERRRRRSPVIAAQACCCCCCCCLHTLGGLVGALVGSLVRVRMSWKPREYDEDADIPFRRDEMPPTFTLPAALVYWGLVSLGTLGTFLALAFSSGTGKVSQSDLFGAGVVTILILPVVQLGAFIVALIAVALCPRSLIPDKSAAVVRVGHIGLWSFVGTLVGLGVMMLLCVALPFFSR